MEQASPTSAAGGVLPGVHYRGGSAAGGGFAAVLRRCLGLAPAALAAVRYRLGGVVGLVMVAGFGLRWHKVP